MTFKTKRRLYRFFFQFSKKSKQDAIDAKRYRYLRPRITPSFLYGVTLEEVDAAIDKVIESSNTK